MATGNHEGGGTHTFRILALVHALVRVVLSVLVTAHEERVRKVQGIPHARTLADSVTDRKSERSLYLARKPSSELLDNRIAAPPQLHTDGETSDVKTQV